MNGQKLSRLTAIRRRSWQAFGTSTLCFPLLVFGLKVWGYRRILGWMLYGPTADIAISDPEDAEQADRSAEIALGCRIAATYSLARPACLPRSMMLWWLLRREGIRSDLRIGVGRHDGEFQAHAWVEQNGRILNDRPDVALRFLPFEEDVTRRGLSEVDPDAVTSAQTDKWDSGSR